MKYMEQIGMRSKATSRSIGLLGQNRRNEALKQAAKELKKQILRIFSFFPLK